MGFVVLGWELNVCSHVAQCGLYDELYFCFLKKKKKKTLYVF